MLEEGLNSRQAGLFKKLNRMTQSLSIPHLHTTSSRFTNLLQLVTVLNRDIESKLSNV